MGYLTLQTCFWSKIQYCCSVFQISVILLIFFFVILLKDERDATCFSMWAFELLEVFWGDRWVGKAHVVELLFKSASSLWWVRVFCYLLFIWSYIHFVLTLKEGLSDHRPGIKDVDNFSKSPYDYSDYHILSS